MIGNNAETVFKKDEIKGAIFDMDGTIMDSTAAWNHMAPALLERWGYVPKQTLLEDIFPLGDWEIARFLKSDYYMRETVEDIYGAIVSYIDHYYCTEARLKKGAKEFLQYLKNRGIKLVLATATRRTCVLNALKLTGVIDLFEEVLTCDEIGHAKSEPDIFQIALNILGTQPQNTWVFEDALHAVRTANRMNFVTCGVGDVGSAFQKEILIIECDYFLEEIVQWYTLPFVIGDSIE